MTDQYIQNIRNNSEKAECYFSKKLAFTLGPVELKELSEERNVKIIDVRMRSDYEIGHIPGAISMRTGISVSTTRNTWFSGARSSC